ncbi:MAG TPA: 23S rRNA (uracil(1939)-C(5))-methyltransferase RlmD [Gammaproteobacteria bacterium]|jgi:23S rRNA (uracil1939-C5)-methyltransferase|nr:23S rRNA (uracil(1939)-C(5))-methyltransferase RlmD [Gammaproteobacteria bacterium]
MNTGPGLRMGAQSATVSALSHDGRGIAKLGGKTLFIEDALPGEEVSFRIQRRHRDYDEARLVEVLKPSPQRVTPRCKHFGVCGGCSLQHLEPAAQLAAKQQALLDSLKRIGGLEPQELLPPLTGPIWGYRRRARFSVHKSEGRIFVGFMERYRPLVAELRHCDVMDPKIGDLIAPLADMLTGLSIAERIPQLEAAVGDDATVLVLQVFAPLTDTDRGILTAFEDRHGVRFYLQSGHGGSAAPLRGTPVELHYRLPESKVDIRFRPADFTQVNDEINRRLVSLAMKELDVQAGDDVLDLFCGLGNFTLPLARVAAQVTGVEGEAELVRRARENAQLNKLENVGFELADLFAEKQLGHWSRRPYARILLDPPRAGAREIIARFPKFAARRIVYVSCHPATLARDAKTLVTEQGWKLTRSGVLDMFPHTSHVESIAVFDRKRS